ncbi:Uncharacterised protein [Phocoenobacter uteri]|uniref:Uncharacterized protein n=1 Tax=Phocoenobacter uteri TaxID=146806 RepID=A0A379C856_9PAST|nr:hypothetical protein [Phocoenobacter uteri]SUB58562.1 Uncharacterised protein [Phocoenobacter uteri]
MKKEDKKEGKNTKILQTNISGQIFITICKKAQNQTASTLFIILLV